VGSFKVKLVAYFLLLSLLPLAAAFWGFSTVASQSEARRVDARLQAGLRATLATYQEALGAANIAAERLARQPSFQRALLAHDRPALERMLRGRPHLAVEAPGGFRVGKRDALAPTRQVAVVGAGGTRGAVVASVPLDAALVSRLETRSGLERADHVLLVEDGRIVAGPVGLRGRFDLLSGKPRTVSLGGTRYRALVAGTLDGRPTATLGVISPQTLIDAANRKATNQLLIGLVATWRYRLVDDEELSLTPSLHWPEPIVLIDPEASEGPAVTLVEYRIDPKTAEKFLQTMKEMKRIRQRDGAIRWNLLRDTADPERYIETFVTESWADHLRQHERVTAEDREVEQRAEAFHLGPEPPKITHLIAEQLPK